MSLQDKFKYRSRDYINSYCVNNNIDDRNNFRDDVYILVIGNFTYIEDMVTFYRNIKNVLFVVDETESKENIKILKDNNIDYIITELPENQGYGNVNFQCKASLTGVQHLIDNGIDYCIRMRSDQIIVQLVDFINNFEFSKIGFFSIINNCPENFDSWNDYFLDEKVDKSKLTNNYLMDYCITGPTKELVTMFDFIDSTCKHGTSNSLVGHTDCSHTAAEHKIYLNYLVKNNMSLDNSISTLKENHFFLMDCLTTHNIEFLMLKQNYHDWSVAMPLQPEIYVSHKHGSTH